MTARRKPRKVKAAPAPRFNADYLISKIPIIMMIVGMFVSAIWYVAHQDSRIDAIDLSLAEMKTTSRVSEIDKRLTIVETMLGLNGMRTNPTVGVPATPAVTPP